MDPESGMVCAIESGIFDTLGIGMPWDDAGILRKRVPCR